jgi:branched-chain amino acid transport system substrate-binding protein
MMLSRRRLLAGSAALSAALTTPFVSRPAFAQTPTIKIGVLADFSGLYTDLLGLPGVECAKQAVEEHLARDKSFSVEVVYADHQNKADVGTAIVRRWFDNDGVDMMLAGPNSSVELAASFVCKEKDKACLGVAVTSTDFTGKQCTPVAVNWTYDGYMFSKAVATETVKAGGKTWYFISSDNAFGNSLTEETTRFVEQAGGKVLGNAKAPLNSSDFSSFLLAAQSSGADVLALSIGGSDMAVCVKQAGEFGLNRKMKITALVTFLGDIHAVGLNTMQGLLFTNSFYWDLNDRTRAFTKRVLPRMGGMYPGMTHAGCYGVTVHYLKAVAAMGAAAAKKSGAAVVAKMKEMPSDDDAFGPGTIRADGRAALPAYLLQVKSPAESKGAWDYCKVVSTASPEQATKPLAEVGCPLIKA